MHYILTYHSTVESLLNNTPETLPTPDAEAKNRSQLVKRQVQAACEDAAGWIRFSDYMNIALYQPAIGYYTGGLQKFGEQGDFITAPEVSPLFGQCLANQVAEVLQHFKQASHTKNIVLEFGAGSGVLAVDILLALENLESLPDRYLILELSAELQQRQQEKIKQLAPHLYHLVFWLNELPTDVTNVVVIANEVLDAMPVECFRIKDNRVESLMVGVEADALVSRYALADEATEKVILTLGQRSEIVFADNYRSEYNPAIRGWLAGLVEQIETMVMLLIDYGYNEKEYYHPDRTDGTLMCYYQHRAHNDYLRWPGLQDITAFVNYTDVAYCAIDLEMEVCGYTTQAAFLLASGLSALHAAQVTDDIRQQVKLSQQIKTLTLPSEMGERFKVMALAKNYVEPLTGFSLLDLRNRL